MEVVAEIWDFLEERAAAGATLIALRGPRRAAKTWTVSQFLLNAAFENGDKCIFASMTEAQGDAGAFDDCRNIIANNDAWQPRFTITRSPRRIDCKVERGNSYGSCIFRSYRDPQTAKGGACDWVFMNEGNAFTLEQYYAISANARKGVIVDFNPDSHFWIEKLLAPENELHVDWTWNERNLTEAQRKWYADITERALSPEATAADVYYYKVYVLGEYAELAGNIFTPANLHKESVDKNGMELYFVYGDPSALCGADYFAMVLAGIRKGVVYIMQVFSRNVGSRLDVAEQLERWCHEYDVREIFIEGNGLVGKTFIEEQRPSFPNMRPYTNSDNKHGRILGNYEGICSRVVFDTNAQGLDEYLKQVYAYEGKNSTSVHDDNIDAVNSAYEIAHRRFRAF